MRVRDRMAPHDLTRRRLWLAWAAAAIPVFGLAASRHRLAGLFENTALLTAGTLAIALPLGALLGTVAAKIDVPGRRVILAVLLALLFVPLYVQAGAWQTLLGPGGWLTSKRGDPYAMAWLSGWRGAIWVHGVGAVPWIALFVAAALKTVERRLEEESLLDASGARVLLWVSLRRAASGLIAGALWTAVVCSTEIAVTDLYQIRTVAEEVYTQASLGPLAGVAPLPGQALAASPADPLSQTPLAASDLAIAVAVLALLGVAAILASSSWAPQAATIAADSGWMWRPRHGRRAIAAVAWATIASLTAFPLAGLVWRAGATVRQEGENFIRIWSPARVVEMIARSPWEHRREWGWTLAIGGLAVLSVMVFAIAAAWIACRRTGLRRALAILAAVLLAVPAPLVGLWTIAVLNRPADSPLSWLATLYDRTLLAPVLVQTWRALPLVGIWLWLQLSTVPRDLLEAARSEGASSVSQLVRVALPIRRGALVVAALLALVLAAGELSATLLVTPPGVTTISVRVFQLLHYGADDRVAALCLSIFAVLALAAGFAVLITSRMRPARPDPGQDARPTAIE